MTTPEHSIDPLLPAQMAEACERAGVRKAGMDTPSTLVLSFLAGAFIALGAAFFTIVVSGSELGYGPTRLLGGVAFSLGLVLVIIGGAELFTGNALIVMAWANRKVSTARLLRNWGLVFVGNFAGATSTALLVFLSGQWRFGGGAVGETALRIGRDKTDHTFVEAVALGILCNVLVTLAVWLTFSARSNIDKVVAIVFPISAFVAAGFEHSIANMYFLPLALLVKTDDSFVASTGLTGDGGLDGLTWTGFLVDNLLPVTIGNIIGGALMVAGVYWFVYLRPKAA
ncbi:MAG: formate/nitrite transporter family protein [Dehalococcoidia bacterium]